ncbi:hypothetical protein Tcan_09534 [Toxocara canis]|nr:hypothetical protein Tcan_09534 [Toxocara canis]
MAETHARADSGVHIVVEHTDRMGRAQFTLLMIRFTPNTLFQYAEKFSVETTVPEFGAPRRIFEGDTFYESHTSVIEEYEFKIDSKATKEGNKHKNFSIDIHILGRQCPG